MTFMKTYIVAVRGQTEKLKLIKSRGDLYFLIFLNCKCMLNYNHGKPLLFLTYLTIQ